MARADSALSARVRRLYWRHVRRHPYEICHRCGRPVAAATGPTWWSASDELWYEVQGDTNGIRCMACFTEECHAAGVAVYWRPVVSARQTTTGRWVEMEILFPEDANAA